MIVAKFSNKLAPYRTGGDSYLLPTSKSRDKNTETKVKHPAPISFRYCPLIEESVVIYQPHYKWGRR